MDKYWNFSELMEHEVEGRDYVIRVRNGNSPFVIIAPHGGKIERGTSKIADIIASREHGFYAFEGIKKNNNQHLHITSDRFDEPRAMAVAARAQTVITIHGAKGKEQAVYTGGLDEDLEQRIQDALQGAGFNVEHDPSSTRQGKGAANICNRGRSGKGMQIELTQGLRQKIFNPPADDLSWTPNEHFHKFVAAVRVVLDSEND